MRLNSITFYAQNAEWVVVLVEGGVETRRSFKNEHFARNWYEGQRVRLGLPLMEDYDELSYHDDRIPAGKTL